MSNLKKPKSRFSQDGKKIMYLNTIKKNKDPLDEATALSLIESEIFYGFNDQVPEKGSNEEKAAVNRIQNFIKCKKTIETMKVEDIKSANKKVNNLGAKVL